MEKNIDIKTFWSLFGGLILVIVSGIILYEGRLTKAESNQTELKKDVEKQEMILDVIEQNQKNIMIQRAEIIMTLKNQEKVIHKLDATLSDFNHNMDFFFDLNPKLRRPGRKDNKEPPP